MWSVSIVIACNKLHYVGVTQAPKGQQHWDDLWYTTQNRPQCEQSSAVAEATQADNRRAALKLLLLSMEQLQIMVIWIGLPSIRFIIIIILHLFILLLYGHVPFHAPFLLSPKWDNVFLSHMAPSHFLPPRLVDSGYKSSGLFASRWALHPFIFSHANQ